MEIDIISLFPEYFEEPLRISILGRAQKQGKLVVRTVQLRDFSEDKHGRVDDRPYGGGPGMVLQPGPLVRAIRSVKKPGSKVIYLSPQGTPLHAGLCAEMSSEEHLILICGHYEGIDERVLELEIDMEVSIGDFVLTSGCPAALVLIDAVSRFIPGVLGDDQSAVCDSFSVAEGFDHPQYTRPPLFEGLEVPALLQNGHHAEITKWRRARARTKFEKIRPDLSAIGHMEKS